jgi:hypothetical protein
MQYTTLIIFVVFYLCSVYSLPCGITIQESALDNPILATVKVSQQILYLRTNTKIYRSTDGGKNFIDETVRLPNYRQGVSQVFSMIKATTDSNYVFFAGLYGDFWSTIDGGNTYRFFNVSSLGLQYFLRLFPHPLIPDLICASGAYLQVPPSTYAYFLFTSKNAGLTWALASQPLSGGSPFPQIVNTQVSWGGAGTKASNSSFYGLFFTPLGTSGTAIYWYTSNDTFTSNSASPFYGIFMADQTYYPSVDRFFFTVIYNISSPYSHYYSTATPPSPLEQVIYTPGFNENFVQLRQLAVGTDKVFFFLCLRCQ